MNKYEKYKDSGFDWIGEIPEHWEVKRVATFGSFSKGKGIPRSELKDDGFPAILYGDIYTKYNIKAEIMNYPGAEPRSIKRIFRFVSDPEGRGIKPLH